MSKESLNDFNLYNNVYIAMSEGDSMFQDETTNTLLEYYRMFLDRFPSAVEDPSEYLGSEEGYNRFKNYFMLMYKHHFNMPNARYAVPLFIYLYDSNPMGFNAEKFDSFVNKSYGLDFSELLSIYDVYDSELDMSEVSGRARA